MKGANGLGNANGTASGMALLAHLAVYEACPHDGCPESAVIAAMDLAIRDGVDVISLSVGSFPKKSFLPDTTQIAAFQAVQHGIFVSCSAGNVGPFNGSVSGPALQAPLIVAFLRWPSL